TLHLDTLAHRADTRGTKRVEVDRVDLPATAKGMVLATECWRDDSASSGIIVAHVRETDEQYFVNVVAAWEVDRALFRIRQTAVTDVECLNRHHNTEFPEAPRTLRSAAITFRPSPGTSRIYAYLPGYSLESAVA